MKKQSDNFIENQPFRIDVREKSETRIDFALTQAEDYGVVVEFVELSVGDYLFPELGIAFEYKTTKDYVQSLISGRLFEQCVDMEQYPYPFLIVDGNWTYKNSWSSFRFTQEQQVGSLAAIVARTKLKVLQFASEYQSTSAMFAVANKLLKPEKIGDVSRHITPIKTDDPYLTILLTVPGIGIKRAEKLQIEYPTWKLFFEAFDKGKISLPTKSEEFLDDLTICD